MKYFAEIRCEDNAVVSIVPSVNDIVPVYAPGYAYAVDVTHMDPDFPKQGYIYQSDTMTFVAPAPKPFKPYCKIEFFDKTGKPIDRIKEGQDIIIRATAYDTLSKSIVPLNATFYTDVVKIADGDPMMTVLDAVTLEFSFVNGIGERTVQIPNGTWRLRSSEFYMVQLVDTTGSPTDMITFKVGK